MKNVPGVNEIFAASSDGQGVQCRFSVVENTSVVVTVALVWSPLGVQHVGQMSPKQFSEWFKQQSTLRGDELEHS